MIRTILMLSSVSLASSLGIGFDQTLIGVKGLSLRYQFMDRYLIQVVGDVVGFGKEATAYSGAGRLFYKFNDQRSLGIYLGLGFGATNHKSGYDLHSTDRLFRDSLLIQPQDDIDVGVPMAMEIPLLLQWRILPALSFNLSFGAKFGLFLDHEWGYRGSFTQTSGLSFWYDFGSSKNSPSLF